MADTCPSVLVQALGLAPAEEEVALAGFTLMAQLPM